MDNKQINSDKDDEIDLVHVYKKVMVVFKGRFLLFLACITVGITLGMVYYIFMPKTYKSRMVVSSSLFQATSFVIILDHVQNLIEENNLDQLALDLNIKKEVAEKIRKIEVSASKNYTNEMFNGKAFFERDEMVAIFENQQYIKEKREEYVIVAFVEDTSAFRDLQAGILYYLSNHPSINERSKIKKAALEEVNAKILKQIVDLDSLKNSILLSFKKQDVTREVFIGDPGKMYLDLVQLYNSRISTNQEMFDAQIRVIENFPVYTKQHSPKLKISLIVAVLFSVILFIIIAVSLVKENKEVAA